MRILDRIQARPADIGRTAESSFIKRAMIPWRWHTDVGI
jgi:hypothetical protein